MNRRQTNEVTGGSDTSPPTAAGLTLRQAAAQLRDQPPDPAVSEAVFAALNQAARTESRRPEVHAPLANWLGFGLASGLLVAGVAALVVHASQQEQQVFERERLIDLALDDGDPDHFELDLSTEQHDADHRVRIEAPAHVQVSLHPHRPSLAPRCSATTCVHEFARDENTASRLRLSVSRPGTYPVRVHHDSPRRSVRQDVVLRASLPSP